MDDEPKLVRRSDYFLNDDDDNEGTLEQLLEEYMGQDDFYAIKDSKFTKNTLTKLKEFIKEHHADLLLATVSDLDDLPPICVHCAMPASEPERYLCISTEMPTECLKISVGDAIEALA